MTCIFIFRRDLRLVDNKTLIKALKTYDKVLPVFIYDSKQIKNPFASQHFLAAQEEGLDDLHSYLQKKGSKLHRFYGKVLKVVQYLISEYKPSAIAFNKDYSYYALERDSEIQKFCAEKGVQVLSMHDVLIYVKSPLVFNKKFGTFAEGVKELTYEVTKNGLNNYDKRIFAKEYAGKFAKKLPGLYTREKAIENLAKDLKTGYHISVHLKLGLISAREVYKYAYTKALKEGQTYKLYLAKNMIWREFFFANWIYHMSIKADNYNFYDQRFHQIIWLNRPEEIKALWSARTGYPLIDASVNELNKTGYMWNRGRLLVGSFSVKILRINPWLYAETPETSGGQAYFTAKLTDCCYANNTGNWHWVASDTIDASGQRFGHGWSGRSFNPETIQPLDKEYIEKWLPYEECEQIVNWHERWQEWREFTSLTL